MTRWNRGRPAPAKQPYVPSLPPLRRPALPSPRIGRHELREALTEFWDRARELSSIVDRLMLLQEFAERQVYQSPKRRYAQIRRGSFDVEAHGHCWACTMRPAHCRHHIVQVQHGGLNWSLNGVCICHGCHAVIHPWMRTKPSPRPRE